MMYPQFMQPTGLPKVFGIEGAKGYQLAPSSQVALFDANDDLFYLKSTDASGLASIRTFRFEEVQEPKPEDLYATKAQVAELTAKIDELMGALNG